MLILNKNMHIWKLRKDRATLHDFTHILRKKFFVNFDDVIEVLHVALGYGTKFRNMFSSHFPQTFNRVCLNS